MSGAVATATLNAGGRVWGIIPRALLANERGAVDVKGRRVPASTAQGLREPSWVDAEGRPSVEVASGTEPSSRATLVGSMHERKQLMAKLAEKGFVGILLLIRE